MGIKIQWNSNNQPGKLFLIVPLVFGVLGAAVGSRWFSNGDIVIREGSANSDGAVAGIIKNGDMLFYPLCTSWVLLGLTMIALAALAFFSSREIFLRLSAYSCLTFFVLGFATVAAALWYGP